MRNGVVYLSSVSASFIIIALFYMKEYRLIKVVSNHEELHSVLLAGIIFKLCTKYSNSQFLQFK